MSLEYDVIPERDNDNDNIEPDEDNEYGEDEE